MTRAFQLALALAMLAGPVAQAATPEQRGLEVATKEAAEYDGFGTEKASYDLILIDAKGVTTSREMLYHATEMDNEGDRTRIEITAPPDVKGTRLLTWSMKTGSDKQWLYMPALSTTKRISGGGKTGAFMGSEFSYEDMASIEVEKYTYKFLEEGEVDGRAVWTYERYPVDNASGYSKHVVTSDKEYLQPVKIDFYDRKGALLKTMTIKGYKRVQDQWRWSEIHVANVQTGKQSRLVAKDREIGLKLDQFYFQSATLAD